MKHPFQQYIKSAPSDDENVAVEPAEVDTEVVVDTEAVKAGRRNSKSDMEKIQQVHDHSCALGAACDMGNTAKSPLRGSTKASEVNKTEALEMPLDTLVEAVRNTFYALREKARMAQKPFDKDEDDYWQWNDTEVPWCIAVYDGFAVVRIKLQHYKVEYVIEDGEIKLSPQSDWQTVTQDWVIKSLPDNFYKDALEAREVGTIKSLGTSRLGNYLVVWGDKDKRDLTGEFFTKSTEGLTAIFDSIGKIPALYHHGMDGAAKYTPVGVIDVMVADDVGLWTETQLDMANKYAVEVQKLAKKRALGASSGALPAARKVGANGEIKAWPIIEGSFTPTPAEPRLREFGVAEVKAIYEELGLELPNDVKSSESTGVEKTRPADDIELERERLRLFELSISA